MAKSTKPIVKPRGRNGGRKPLGDKPIEKFFNFGLTERDADYVYTLKEELGKNKAAVFREVLTRSRVLENVRKLVDSYDANEPIEVLANSVRQELDKAKWGKT